MTLSLRPIGGFTLIEMLLALSLFSLLLTMGYQTIAAESNNSARVTQALQQQASLRATYRSLTNAFKSMAPVTGNQFEITFDLSRADSPWLQGSKVIRFVINAEQEMWAYIDDDDKGTQLIQNIDRAEFAFVSNQTSLGQWQSPRRPNALELKWIEGGERQRWRFTH
jgi:prepilin-type N-terminal cleavage/methylation domain-containing protein